MERLVFVICFFVLAGCNSDIATESVYNRYCREPYLQSWNDGCIMVRAQFMTPELRAAMDMKNDVDDQSHRIKRSVWDSLVSRGSADSMFSFLVRVEPTGKCIDTVYAHNSDVVYGFGRSDDERKQEVKDYLFEIDRRIWLKVNGTRVEPLFTHTEQNFGMDNGRDIWVSFFPSPELRTAFGKGQVSLFFQKPTPVSDVAAMTWPPLNSKRKF